MILSGIMAICPRCAWLLGVDEDDNSEKCELCGLDLIVTETTYDDFMRMSEKQKKELTDFYANTLIRDTYDPQVRVVHEEKVEKIRREYDEKIKINNAVWDRIQDAQSGVSCPYCHSSNTKKISGLSKAGSVALFGIFAIGKTSKQWHCNNCGSNF